MARIIGRAENWVKVYEAYQSVNFNAFDYESIKQSLIDYLKLYHSESFSDFIESSELIAIIELFAYISELYAYRLDLNSHENFITTAQRKESVLRLAKLLSYNPSRNIPARGLVKLTSISTTERLFDSKNNDLSNKIIIWNDPNNQNWKEQFILVINKVLNQNFGSVLPSDRVQVEDVLFELYSFNNNALENGVIKYDVNVSGQSYPMELTPCELNEFGPYEKRPEKNIAMNVLYLNDGLGDASENTGFFVFTKQGNLQRLTADFDGIRPNQTFNIDVDNCNETDVWLNNIDPVTNEIITDDNVLNTYRYGEWERVDLSNSQNIIFNTNPNRNKYEIETLDNDRFRIIFGDGNFANIPSGRFEVWFRISANADVVIPTNALQNIGANFNYYDIQNKEQNFSFSFSLVDPIQNAAPSEDIEHIRRVAPGVYYTQDRMVNGRDYNEYMLKDNSILKLRAINRTFAGDSKYIPWHDPQNYYENTKIFGDDLVVYFRTETIFNRIQAGELPLQDGGANVQLINSLIFNYIQPILSTNEYFINAVLAGASPYKIRKEFTSSELLQIETFISSAIYNTPTTIYFTYDIILDVWSFTTTEPDIWWISLESNLDNSWNLRYLSKKLIVHSDETKFWINNKNKKIITYDTFDANLDQIIILSANIGSASNILNRNYSLDVITEDIIENGEEKGTYSIHDLVTLPSDVTGDGIPDFITLNYLINPSTDFVYFKRDCNNGACPWEFVPYSSQIYNEWENDQRNNFGLWKRETGRENINFLWLHRTPRYHLIDPSPTNIIDKFIITRGYYTLLKQWLSGNLETPPTPPTSFELKSTYSYLLSNKMISDEVILHPGRIKILFGSLADPEMRASFKVIKSKNTNLTNNQIKNVIVDTINQYFDINTWEFGETFYFIELAALVKSRLSTDIDSIVIVPLYEKNVFGDLFQVFAREDEIFQPSISVDDIEIVESLNPHVLRQFT